MYKSCQEWGNKVLHVAHPGVFCRWRACCMIAWCFYTLHSSWQWKVGTMKLEFHVKVRHSIRCCYFLHDATQYPEKFCSYMTRKSEKWLLLWRADTCRLWEVELNPNERWHASTSVWFKKQWKAMEAGNRWFERQQANHDITTKLLRKFHFNEASLF